MVQAHYDEGIANGIGPESCAGSREGVGEALTGVCIGQPSSRESELFPGAHAVQVAEGKTNLESTKGTEILKTGKCAMCFHWKSRQRQVRIRGTIELVTDEQADEYFASRPRQSRIGAWASQQSRPMNGRRDLFAAVAKFGLKYAVGPIPRPDYWSGVRLKPSSIEFWQAGEFRLHHRVEYRRNTDENSWVRSMLFP